MSTGVWLGVDYGTATTVAVLRWPDGRWRTVRPGGDWLLPSAVFVTEDNTVAGAAAAQRALIEPGHLVEEPLRRMVEGRIAVGAASVDGVDLVAATLRKIRDAAQAAAGGPVERVRMVVPAWWGPRRRTLLRQAADRAGLGEPTLVNTAIAVASRLMDESALVVPVGSWLAVCDLGTGFEANVVRRSADGLEVVAALHRDAGAHRLDELLAQYLSDVGRGATAGDGTPNDGHDAPERELIAAARSARRSVAVHDAVTVPVVTSRPPIVLTAAQVNALGTPVLDEVAAATVEAIAAAEVRREDCVGVYLVGGGAVLEPVRHELAERLQMPVEVVSEPKLAAVLGAVRAGNTLSPDPDAAAAASAGQAPVPVRRAIAAGLPGAAAILLAVQFVFTIQVNTEPTNLGLSYLLANWGELGLAAVFGLLAALGLATVFASALPAVEGTDGRPADSRQQVGAGIVAAVAAGMTGAALVAILAAVGFPVSNGAFLRWALLTPAPIAAMAALTGALIVRTPAGTGAGWAAALTLPHASVVFAAAGMLVSQFALTAPRTAASSGLYGALALLGAAALGAGVAFAVPLPSLFQIILAAPLAASCAAIVGDRTTGVFAGMYTVAVTLWWARHLWGVLRQRSVTRIPGPP